MSRRAADTQRQEGCDANECSHRLAQTHSLHLTLCIQAGKLQQRILPPIESHPGTGYKMQVPLHMVTPHLRNTA